MKKQRIISIEILRIIAMMMVVTLHYLDKGGYLPAIEDTFGITGYVAWIMECCSIVAVNVFVLISSYFMTETKFRTGRLVSLWLQTEFYSLLLFGVFAATGRISLEEMSTYDKLVVLLPVSMEQYWFISAYFVMFLMAPFLNAAVHNMNQRQHRVLLCFLIFVFSVLKSALPVVLELPGRGYDAFWFVTVYLVGAYIRLYGVPFFEIRSRAVIGYLFSVVAIFTEIMVLRRVYVRTGRLEHIVTISLEYNHIFVLFGAVCLFLLFLPTTNNSEYKDNAVTKIVCFLSPLTLGVYLLHEQVNLRYVWPQMLGVTGADGLAGLLVNWIISVAVLFGSGFVLDCCRNLLFRAGKHLLRNSFAAKQIAKIDEAVNSLPKTETE